MSTTSMTQASAITTCLLVASSAIVVSALLLTRAAESGGSNNNVGPEASPPSSSPLPIVANQSHLPILSVLTESSHVLRGLSESHIVVTIEAPSDLATLSRPPLSVAVVLDRSGSMEGMKLAQAKRAAIELIGALQPSDHFSVITYGTEVNTLLSLRSAGPDAIRAAIPLIDGISEYGGTNISGGISAGRQALSGSSDQVRRIVLISDGHANEGIVGRNQLTEFSQQTADLGITMTTVGVGLDFDETTMAAIAVAGRGNYYFAEKAADLATLFQTELDRVSHTVATDVGVTVVPAQGIEILSAYGHPIVDGKVILADLHAAESRRVVFRVRGRYRELGEYKLATVEVTMKPVNGNPTITEETQLSVISTNDYLAVSRGQNKQAIAMIERAQTAIALSQAADLYQSGKREQAMRILVERRNQARQRAQAIGDEALGRDLARATNAASAAFSAEPETDAGKTGRKHARGAAYKLLYESVTSP